MREHSGGGNATYLRLTIGLEAYRITRQILAARDHVMFLSEIYWSHFICRAHLFLAEGKETHSLAASISEEKYNMEPGMNHGEQVLKDVSFDTVAAPW